MRGTSIHTAHTASTLVSYVGHGFGSEWTGPASPCQGDRFQQSLAADLSPPIVRLKSLAKAIWRRRGSEQAAPAFRPASPATLAVVIGGGALSSVLPVDPCLHS